MYNVHVALNASRNGEDPSGVVCKTDDIRE